MVIRVMKMVVMRGDVGDVNKCSDNEGIHGVEEGGDGNGMLRRGVKGGGEGGDGGEGKDDIGSGYVKMMGEDGDEVGKMTKVMGTRLLMG